MSAGDGAPRAARIPPAASYRLQFTRAFTFRDALALVPYLHALGASELYASPILHSRPGGHGYDVCNHAELNPELGSAEDFDALAAALRERGMGLILDVVPNHMGIDEPCNTWWLDVLENGPSSAYAGFFDVLWKPIKSELENKVLIPILGDQYGNVLENGQLRLRYEDGAFAIYYYEHKLPVAPRTYRQILELPLADLEGRLGAGDERVQELQSILTALGYLPPRTETDVQKLAERAREKEIIKRRLGALVEASPDVRAALDAAVRTINGTPGDPRSFDRLDRLIEAQAVRPSFWRVAAEEINYRRFFDINELAAIRVERPEVFQATHALVLQLLAEGKASGVRVDHPDGLWDPAGYFRDLQAAYARVRNLDEPGARPLYIVAEKILGAQEALPAEWAVDGTTGYDFLNQVNGLFVDPAGCSALERAYARFAHGPTDFHELSHLTKRLIMRIALVSEINTLGRELERIAERNRHYRDFTLNGLIAALREVIAALQVYRTYVNAVSGAVSERDRQVIAGTIAEAKRATPQIDASVFDFIRDTWLLANFERFSEEDRAALAEWVMKFQQLTGPVMAKGVEDTAFYRYNRLIALNEVGGHPDRFGVSAAEFHACNAERREQWPHTLLATSTHDTKRGEDARARIDVLSEMPQEWRRAVARWSRLNARKKTPVDGVPAPGRDDEYLFYQSLLGAWPMQADEARGPGLAGLRERMIAYMRKATKEAKVHTSWLNSNAAYDAAVERFVTSVLDEHGSARFLADLRAFVARAAPFGRFNSLAQTLLKLTSPGVPDVYQGSELWDLSLVDPDNRRPVDFAARAAALRELRESTPGADVARALLDAAPDGRIKLYVIASALAYRGAHQALFAGGDYRPLEARGAQREHVVSFARTLGEQAAVVVVPRLAAKLAGETARAPLGDEVWHDTRLALPGDLTLPALRNLFTGEILTPSDHSLPLAAVFAHFPVALLVQAQEG